MKKQKIFLLVLTLVIVCSLLLTSCTFARINTERQANEVLATVSLDYEGKTLTLDVTRNELLSYVNYLINLYSQYQMQYDVKDLLTDGLDGLINQKYLVLQGMVYLMSIEDRQTALYYGTDEYKAIHGSDLVPEGVLTIAERYKTIADTNETFTKSIDQYIAAYETEQREIRLSKAKEKLGVFYKDGYSVDKVSIYNYNEENETYPEGLYKNSFIYVAPTENNDSPAETDYKEIYLKIALKKSGSADTFVYYPVAASAVTSGEKDLTDMTTAELKNYKESAGYLSNYVTLKTVTVKYDEPVKATVDGEDDSYKAHTATADFTLVTPRTPYKEAEEEEDTRDIVTVAKEGDIHFRYTILSANDEVQKEVIQKGQIFNHSLTSYASDAQKDAYRQFREAKKEQLIGFDPTDTVDPYGNLAYYYKSSFESAVLEAVKHELSRKVFIDSPVTDTQIENEYNTLVTKQQEEYANLTKKKQVEKFAETVKTDLTTCYYIPIDALLTSEYKYEDATYTYATEGVDGKVTINMFYIAHVLFKWTTDLSDYFKIMIEDCTDEEIKTIKTNFVEYLHTNKSKIAYETEGVLEGISDLEAAFEKKEDTGEIKSFLVSAIIEELKSELNTSTDPLATFKKYMSLYNDDNGSMTNKLGYFIAMGDIAHGYDGDDFPNMAKDLYLKILDSSTDPNGAKEVSNYAFTSYGMHIEYISFAPFYNISLTSNNSLGINFALDLEGNTFQKTIKATLVDQVKSNVYTEWTSKFDHEDIKTNHSSKDMKKVKKLIKDLNLN